MYRVYRLSKIGSKLPITHSYGPVDVRGAQAGFEVFKGVKSSIANSVGPAIGSLGEGDLTPRAGYTLLLVVDTAVIHGHPWNPSSWLVVQKSDVFAVRSVVVADIHCWLYEHPECIGEDSQLNRDLVYGWVENNKNAVESWLDQRSRLESVEFIDTFAAG